MRGDLATAVGILSLVAEVIVGACRLSRGGILEKWWGYVRNSGGYWYIREYTMGHMG
jgi:hypothetical protein